LSEAHVILGRIYEKKGRQEDAMEQYKIGIKMATINKFA